MPGPGGVHRGRGMEPAAEILRKADELGVNLVVRRTHGKGLLERVFRGA